MYVSIYENYMKTLNGVFGCLHVCMCVYIYVCICMHVLFTLEGPMVDEPFDSMGYPLEIKTLLLLLLLLLLLSLMKTRPMYVYR